MLESSESWLLSCISTDHRDISKSIHTKFAGMCDREKYHIPSKCWEFNPDRKVISQFSKQLLINFLSIEKLINQLIVAALHESWSF